MSDEAAFLEALRANPADDTARLVLADWLDEHDQPQKAEYLRLVADFAQREGNLATLPGAERFASLAAALANDWRTAAGSRFALVLVGWTDKIRAIKWIGELTGDGLTEAKVAIDSRPHVLFANVPFETASAAFARGRDGSFAELRITAGPPDAETDGRLYDLVVRLATYNVDGPDRPAQLAAARDALAALIAAARDLPADEAADLADIDNDIVLAVNLTMNEARNRRLALNALIPPYDGTRGWWMWMHRRLMETGTQ